VRIREGVREVEEAAERILDAETLFLFPAFSIVSMSEVMGFGRSYVMDGVMMF